MRIVLNQSTETIHKPSHHTTFQPTACGALRHVSDDHIYVTTEEEIEANHKMDHCGRCFEDAGGY